MIREIHASNFKSLKDVSVSLGELSVFCGPNASGKTNFVEALDFLAHVFRSGLQYAVSEKGGFYNICFRRVRRTKGAISFRVLSETKHGKNRNVTLEVSFSIRATSEAIRAEFIVEDENYRLRVSDQENSAEVGFLEIVRRDKKYIATAWGPSDDQFGELFGFRTLEELNNILSNAFRPQAQQLLLTPLRAFFSGFFNRIRRSVAELEGLRVFQINPRTARRAGTPSVTRGLGKHGENLPIVVDSFLNKRHLINRLLSWMQDVIPALESLQPGYTETKQVGPFLQEKLSG